jgi:hypothetical protein
VGVLISNLDAAADVASRASTMSDASNELAPPSQPLRRGILMILWGPHAFRKIVLEPGQTLTIGRTDRANIAVNDPQLSGVHFSIWWSGRQALVRDLGSATGLQVNGDLQPRGFIEHGGFVIAGATTFQIFVEGFTAVSEEPLAASRAARIEAIKAELGPRDGQLYGIFDAARDERVRWVLAESIDAHQNLYEGFEGRILDDKAPYLVRFEADSDLLDRLLIGGWGNAWGIYFRSDAHQKEVRRHARRFLMAEEEETTEKLYFRFYDPRVFRDFVKVATPRQREELLASTQGYFFEAEDDSVASLLPAGPTG